MSKPYVRYLKDNPRSAKPMLRTWPPDDNPSPATEKYDILQSIGLSKLAAQLYWRLSLSRPMTARVMRDQIVISHTQLYRALKDLQIRGFVTVWKPSTLPAHYTALPLPMAMANYAAYQHTLVADLIREQQMQKAQADDLSF